MDFKQIETFVNVARYKSFSRAAEALFLTQPTVSSHISSLEKELGATLIDRRGKESRLTKQGRAFYNYAITLINTRDRALVAMGVFGSEIRGWLDIKTSSIPGQYLVPKLVADFHKEYPEVRFRVTQSDSADVWCDISDNLGEIGFTGEFNDNGLKYEFLFQEPAVLITPATDKFKKLRAASEEIKLEDIADEMFIWREEGSATRRTFEKKLAEKGIPARSNAIAVVNSLEVVKQFVKNGLGVSVLTGAAVENDREKQDYLVFKLDEIDLNREFYMVYNRNVTLSPAAANFRDFVLKTFNSEKSQAR